MNSGRILDSADQNRQGHSRRIARIAAIVPLLLLLAALCGSAGAASVCVNPKGKQGCFSSIQSAIDSVSAPNTTIMVRAGTYTSSCTGPACSVATVSSAAANASSLTGLTLQCGNGSGRSVVLDATNLDHAVYIFGVSGVTVVGCVARNAALEGILVENSNNVHLKNNEVRDNDSAMGTTFGQGNPPCPTFLSPGTPGMDVIQCCPDAFSGGPGNFPQDNDDCGEGIHLRGVTNSVVESNYVHDNIGGILLSDETGTTHDNLIQSNKSSNNLKFGGDCGITMASHLACTAGSDGTTGCTTAPPVGGILQGNGIYNNQVIYNAASGNGASGVGMFANPGVPPGAATKVYGNLVADNVVKNNGEPGISIHVHAANGNADNNTIVENVLSGNGGDEEAEGSPAPNTGIELLSNGNFGAPFGPAAPIVGTTISQNKINHEGIDVWVGNTATDATVSLNSLLGKGAIGVTNAGTGSVTATNNWWGCKKGPGTPNCSSASGPVISTPFLTRPVNPEK